MLQDETAVSEPGGFSGQSGRARGEGLGERLLGSLIDRAHDMPPRLVAPLVSQEIAAVGGREVTIYLQDYDQALLLSLAGAGLSVGDPVVIDGSAAGAAFSTDDLVEQEQPDGQVRLFLPMLDGSDRVGVLAFTLPEVDDDDRRLARRLAGLVADMVVTKGMYTDTFFNARRTRPMSLAAQLQWQLLPPLTMTTPRVALAGILEPAYEVGGDSFDYALNEHVLHVAIVDAMGHGIEAATMATVAVAAYRHARRAGVDLVDLYAGMDEAMATQFGPERFATAQMAEIDTDTGVMTWVNAGHPAPLLLRAGHVVRELTGPTTLPVGFGGASPVVQTVVLAPGDRVLFFTDGLVEELLEGGDRYGSERLHEVVEAAAARAGSVQETVRQLSCTLMADRGGSTSDDATLFLVEWTGAEGEDELRQDVVAVAAGPDEDR